MILMKASVNSLFLPPPPTLIG